MAWSTLDQVAAGTATVRPVQLGEYQDTSVPGFPKRSSWRSPRTIPAGPTADAPERPCFSGHRRHLLLAIPLPTRCPRPLITVHTHAPAHPPIVRSRGTIAGAGFRLLRGCDPSLTSSAPANSEAYAVPGAWIGFRYAADMSQPGDRAAKPAAATADRRSAGVGTRSAAERFRQVRSAPVASPGSVPGVQACGALRAGRSGCCGAEKAPGGPTGPPVAHRCRESVISYGQTFVFSLQGTPKDLDPAR